MHTLNELKFILCLYGVSQYYCFNNMYNHSLTKSVLKKMRICHFFPQLISCLTFDLVLCAWIHSLIYRRCPFMSVLMKVNECLFYSSFCRLEGVQVKRLGYMRGLVLGPYFSSGKLISFAAFLSFVYSGGHLRPDLVFQTLSQFQAIQLATILFIPMAIQFLSEKKVIKQRMEVCRGIILTF